MQARQFKITLSDEERQHVIAALQTLTRREADVLDGVLQARSSKEIALKLGISYRTVEVYRGRLNEKVGAKSSVELVRLVAAAV